MEHLKELSNSELKSINGGSLTSYLLGAVSGAYIDFEIGMAIGIGRAFKKAWDSI